MDAERELLVVLDGADPGLADLRAVAEVTQAYPPRLALVAADPADPAAMAALSAVPEVVGVYGTGPDGSGDGPDGAVVPPDVLAGLDSGERLFVDAWTARAEPAPTPRPGDGLNWGDPGYQPPDPPPREP